jgi:hypothetical protein
MADEAALLPRARTAGWLLVGSGPSVTGAWRKLAIEVLTATGERDATIAATAQRASAALPGDDHRRIPLTVSEAVQWCAGAISHREATRLRHPAAGPLQPG